jgi:hypothetical protein
MCHHHEVHIAQPAIQAREVVSRYMIELRLPRPPANSDDPADTLLKAMEHEEQDAACGICMDDMIDAVRTPCNHVYCLSCMRQWFGDVNRKTCPMDRNVLDWGDLVMA